MYNGVNITLCHPMAKWLRSITQELLWTYIYHNITTVIGNGECDINTIIPCYNAQTHNSVYHKWSRCPAYPSLLATKRKNNKISNLVWLKINLLCYLLASRIHNDNKVMYYLNTTLRSLSSENVSTMIPNIMLRRMVVNRM